MYSELPTLRIAPLMAILGWGFVRVIADSEISIIHVFGLFAQKVGKEEGCVVGWVQRNRQTAISEFRS